ncbi:hypothetical protein EGQ24_01955 [bacterium]|nr:hypothetical protein [bacterium]
MITRIETNTNYNYYKRGQSFRASASFANKSVNTAYKSIDVNSADFIKYVFKKIKNMCNRPFEINVESGKIMDIVNSNEPHIFIMNHTRQQPKDINGAMFFNSLLYREYIYQNKANDCPRSKVFAGEGFLKRSNMPDELEFMGVIPINAKAENKNAKEKNRETIQNIVDELSEGKINFFIYPEGAMAIVPFLPLKYKFQPGVSAIIKRVLEKRDSIDVIPLTFAHDKTKSAIHIGEAVKFSKKNGQYYTNKGNSDSKFFDKKFENFYKDKDEILLTNNGQPVKTDDVVPFISGVLSENLDCCIKEAKNDLKHSNGKVYLI